MKYKDILYNISLLEKEYSQEINRIEIVKIDFDCLAEELKIKNFSIGNEKLLCFEYENVIFCEEKEHDILKLGRATFFSKRNSLNLKKIMIFTTKDVLSEEEIIIKKLIE